MDILLPGAWNGRIIPTDGAMSSHVTISEDRSVGLAAGVVQRFRLLDLGSHFPCLLYATAQNLEHCAAER